MKLAVDLPEEMYEHLRRLADAGDVAPADLAAAFLTWCVAKPHCLRSAGFNISDAESLDRYLDACQTAAEAQAAEKN